MKNAPAAKSNESASNRGHSITLPPRQKRLLQALLSGPVTREQADRISRASNSPDVVARLRARGVCIRTERVRFVTCDGRNSFYGRYWIDRPYKAAARDLLRGG